MNPFKILHEAIKAVPAVRYALAVAGVVSVVAIVQAFKLDLRVALFGTVAVLLLMVIMVIFAKLSRSSAPSLKLPALVFTWFSLALTMAVATTLFMSVFFSFPINLTSWLGVQDTVKKEATKEQVRFQFDNTGTWFGTYVSGLGVADVVGNNLLITIVNGRVKRNPTAGNRSVKYISIGLAQPMKDSWDIVSQSSKQAVNWQFLSDSDEVSLEGLRFSIPILNQEQLRNSWVVVDLSDGEGSVYAHSGPLF